MRLVIGTVAMVATLGCGGNDAPSSASVVRLEPTPAVSLSATPAALALLARWARCLDTVAEGYLAVSDVLFFCMGRDVLDNELPNELIFGGNPQLRSGYVAWRQRVLDFGDGGFERLCGEGWPSMSVTECEGAEDAVRDLAAELRALSARAAGGAGPRSPLN